MQGALKTKEIWELANDNQGGLTMHMIENLPIYFRTDDARINAFLQKNRLHHSMQRPPQRSRSLNISMTKTGGNGRIRTWLFICAVVALYLFFAMQSWGWINV